MNSIPPLERPAEAISSEPIDGAGVALAHLLGRAMNGLTVRWSSIAAGGVVGVIDTLPSAAIFETYRAVPAVTFPARELVRAVLDGDALDRLTELRGQVLSTLGRYGISLDPSSVPYRIAPCPNRDDVFDVGLAITVSAIPDTNILARTLTTERQLSQLRRWIDSVAFVLENMANDLVEELGTEPPLLHDAPAVRVYGLDVLGPDEPLEFEVVCRSTPILEQVHDFFRARGAIVLTPHVPQDGEQTIRAFRILDARGTELTGILADYMTNCGSFTSSPTLDADGETDWALAGTRPIADPSRTVRTEIMGIRAYIRDAPDRATVSYKMIEDRFKLAPERAWAAIALLCYQQVLVPYSDGGLEQFSEAGIDHGIEPSLRFIKKPLPDVDALP